MPKKNIPLLKRLRTRFLRMRHAEHFDMATTARRNECGTAMCIAGHALDLEGYKLRFDQFGYLDVVIEPSSGRRLRSPLREAASLLGMEYYDEAFNLFHAFDLTTPKQAAARIERIIAEAEA